jgi:hypothetical protein
MHVSIRQDATRSKNNSSGIFGQRGLSKEAITLSKTSAARFLSRRGGNDIGSSENQDNATHGANVGLSPFNASHSVDPRSTSLGSAPDPGVLSCHYYFR